MKISFITITARNNHPYQLSTHHLFHPTMQTLKNQTLQDFEWIIIDALYSQRPNHFKKLKLPFTVKHVPANPNIWHTHHLPGISTQYNKGIIYADGELLFFTGDSFMMNPYFMSNLWKNYCRNGYFSLAWYVRDYKHLQQIPGPDGDTPLEPSVKAPIPYNLCGYKGENVAVEHRYKSAFNVGSANHRVSWEWWFGCSSASITAMLQLNGFDQKMDGDYTLMDCDVGSRLNMAGYKFSMHRNLFLVRLPSNIRFWSKTIVKNKKESLKCNYGILWLNRTFKQVEANRKPLTDVDVKWIKQEYCGKQCPMRKTCKEKHSIQHPFINRQNINNYLLWKKICETNQVDLQEERELRFSNHPKYQEETVKWAK